MACGQLKVYSRDNISVCFFFVQIMLALCVSSFLLTGAFTVMFGWPLTFIPQAEGPHSVCHSVNLVHSVQSWQLSTPVRKKYPRGFVVQHI